MHLTAVVLRMRLVKTIYQNKMRPLDPQRRKEYHKLFQTCVIRPERLPKVRANAGRILANQERYRAVENACRVPRFVVGVIHSLEGDLNFSTHLHNGDPLTQRTIHVPKSRPQGQPPFTWVESAIDALHFDGLTANRDWSVAGILNCLEQYETGKNRGLRRLRIACLLHCWIPMR